MMSTRIETSRKRIEVSRGFVLVLSDVWIRPRISDSGGDFGGTQEGWRVPCQSVI